MVGYIPPRCVPYVARFSQIGAWIGEVDYRTEKFFDEHGWEFVGDICEQSEALGSNANATGKSRPLWNNLRTKMELHRMKILASKA